MPCSLSQPLICSGDQLIWRNFASILLRVGTVSLRGLLRIACRAKSSKDDPDHGRPSDVRVAGAVED